MSKKIEEGKPFNIYKGKRPKVLLIGNGIPRAFGGIESWNEFLDKIKDEKTFTLSAEEYDIPMSLKVTMLSRNNLESKLNPDSDDNKNKNNEKDNENSLLTTNRTMKEELVTFLEKLLDLNFDYILTTNYTYELECAAMNTLKITPEDVKKLQSFHPIEENSRAQTKFYTTTFNRIDGKNEGKAVDIWHIHGELYNPQSIALSNEYYGKLINKYIETIAKRFKDKESPFKRFKTKEPAKFKSWIEVFLFGNVYILGFGMGFDERDLWWLLEYKAGKKNLELKESKKNSEYKKFFGTTTFLEKNFDHEQIEVGKSTWCKNTLLKILGADVSDLNFQTKETDKNKFYQKFYEEAYERLKKEVGERTKK